MSTLGLRHRKSYRVALSSSHSWTGRTGIKDWISYLM